MFVAVHPRILDQDVQAVDEGPRRCRPIGMKCTCVRDRALLELHSASRRLNLRGKSPHITEVMALRWKLVQVEGWAGCWPVLCSERLGRHSLALAFAFISGENSDIKTVFSELLCPLQSLAQLGLKRLPAFATGCCGCWRNASTSPPISAPTPFTTCA